MSKRTVMQEALFYSFRIEDHVPGDHLLRSTDRFVDLDGIREHLKPFNSAIDRPSVDPELMIRMLLIRYCMGIRSERRLRLRGPDGAKDEFDLAAAAQNLRKLNN